jgi:hypothetical protein
MQWELLAQGPLNVVQVQLDRLEAVRLHRPVPVRVEVLLLERRKRDRLDGRDGLLGRLAAREDELSSMPMPGGGVMSFCFSRSRIRSVPPANASASSSGTLPTVTV